MRASSVVQFPYAGMGASGLIMSPAISLWMVPPTIRHEGLLQDGGFSMYGSNLTESHLVPTSSSYPNNLSNSTTMSEVALNKN